MTAAAFVCLTLGVSALALCCATWYGRVASSQLDGWNKATRSRNGFALSALLCATSSASTYVAFGFLWVYSSHSFNGRQPRGAVMIWVGLLTAVYAIVGGLFARGVQRLGIVVSSAMAACLWALAAAASVVV